jgi:hypothetical protein
MFPDSGQIIDGKIGPVKEICVDHALATFLERRERDTNPKIVKMLVNGKPISHWYYRSEEWIDQPYYMGRFLVQPYVGPANGLGALVLYQEDMFVEDESMMEIAVDYISERVE